MDNVQLLEHEEHEIKQLYIVVIKHPQLVGKRQLFDVLISNLCMYIWITRICYQFVVGGREEASSEHRRDKAGIV